MLIRRQKAIRACRLAARLVSLGVVVAALLAVAGLAPRVAAAQPQASPLRIVSIGGAVNEILFALGMGDRVVAVDQTSRYPAAARALPDVGYARALSPEGVLSVGPTLILAMEGAGPPSTMEVLKQASVPVVVIPDGHDREAVLHKIAAVAKAVGAEEKGRALAAEVSDDFAALDAMVKVLPERPRAVFVLSASGGAAVVGGSDTSADAILKLAGLTNAMAEIKGFKPALDEAAMSAEPEAVVVMRGGGQVLDAATVFALPAFAGTPAARDKRLVALPGSYLLGFGPRTPRAARDLAAALHPGAKLPELPARPWSTEPDQ
ncbi:heme/hemin ABC transporter substrate-binding protein [Xanthobacter aminoxidans]|uniref:heme/hemin ABC transporter substrate-binding protein n=1 Tax=Xanthobacter aminoxidans TaxID=186280 RepID=UPI0024DF26F1|nr:ABC transporter substrate-binding protein [Xanthobacter aminoxidans]MCL8382176.1 ABC transporter substrate-binding protein [Xanthobacter aminoxidans]